MTTIKSMGDLRTFLVETMQGVRDGTVECNQAGQVAKLAAQINASIHAEIAARTHLNVKEQRSFNGLALIDSHEGDDSDHDAKVTCGTVVAEESENTEVIEGAESTIRIINARTPEWYPGDWPEISGMLEKGKSRETIAGDYGVTLQELDDFIEQNGGKTLGKALPRPTAGA